MRRIAARIRRAEPPNAPAELVRAARTHLRNRAGYNARRQQVRNLAARVQQGERPTALPDLMRAVSNYLGYRAWYNERRRQDRRNSSGPQRPTSRNRPRS